MSEHLALNIFSKLELSPSQFEYFLCLYSNLNNDILYLRAMRLQQNIKILKHRLQNSNIFYCLKHNVIGSISIHRDRSNDVIFPSFHIFHFHICHNITW